MSPDERTNNASLFDQSIEASLQSIKRDLTIDRLRLRQDMSRSTSSKGTQPSWFAPAVNSSPQKSTLVGVRPVQHSNTMLPLSPPLSLYGSTPSSSRSVEDDLSTEFHQISTGLRGLSRQANAELRRASLECREGELIREYNGLVGKLPKREKKTRRHIHVEESNFHIDSTSSGSSSERLHTGGSGIEDIRANIHSRGMGSDAILSPPYHSPHKSIQEERREIGVERNAMRTDGTQTDFDRRRVEVQSRGTMMEEEEEKERERRTRRKKERVRIVADRSSSSSPARERLPPRVTKHTVRKEPEREAAGHDSGSEGRVRREYFDVSLPSCLSLPTRNIRLEPFDLSTMSTTLPARLEHRGREKRQPSPRREREVRVEKTRKEIVKEDKEKRANGWFPPVVDIDQMRGRKKCVQATKATLGGEGVKKTIGEEKKVVRRGASVGVGVNRTRKRDPSLSADTHKPPFVASTQVDGVSHSLSANRQQLLNLIKCHLPLVHLKVKEYMEGTKAATEHDIASGLTKFLQEELTKIMMEEEEALSSYDGMEDGEKKEELAREIERRDVLCTETKYLIRELEKLSSRSISSSMVNQLRCIYSHLQRCPPLRSEE